MPAALGATHYHYFGVYVIALIIVSILEKDRIPTAVQPSWVIFALFSLPLSDQPFRVETSAQANPCRFLGFAEQVPLAAARSPVRINDRNDRRQNGGHGDPHARGRQRSFGRNADKCVGTVKRPSPSQELGSSPRRDYPSSIFRLFEIGSTENRKCFTRSESRMVHDQSLVWWLS